MKYLPEFEEKLNRAIRDSYALDPIMSVYSLQEVLEQKFKRKFTRHYLARRIKKLSGQMRYDLDKVKVKDRLDQTRETYRIARERLLKIIYWKPEDARNGIKPPFHAEIIDACKNLVMMDLALIEAEVKNGVYQRPIEAIAHEIRYDPLPQEIRDPLIAAWERGGMLPKSVIETIIPKVTGLPMVIKK